MNRSNNSVAIIGADGQLGADLVDVFRETWDVIPFTHVDFDVSDEAMVREKIMEVSPAFVINTAAFHDVVACEKDPAKSFAVNAIGAYNVAKAAAECGAGIVFLSTDYVFDGSKRSFLENDIPNPLNIYGASKLAGEMLARIANPRHYVVRTTGLFGVHPSKKRGYNFVTLMLKLAKEGKPISVVDDQFCSPTYTRDFAEKIKEMLEKQLPSGVYHVTNGGGISWYKFAKTIFKLAGVSPQLLAVKTTDRSDGVTRALSTVLENRALVLAGIEPPRPLDAAISAYLQEQSLL